MYKGYFFVGLFFLFIDVLLFAILVRFLTMLLAGNITCLDAVSIGDKGTCVLPCGGTCSIHNRKLSLSICL